MKKDISILLIEKLIHPEASLIHSNLSGVGHFLNRHGFNVDMVWSIINYKFENFEEFKKEAEKTKELEISKSYELFKKEIGENYAQNLKKSMESKKPQYALLRKTPINSIDDLANYGFILIHPDVDDLDMMYEFIEKYPNIPIIFPSESGQDAGGREEHEIPGVFKDELGHYIIDFHSGYSKIIKLIEYL